MPIRSGIQTVGGAFLLVTGPMVSWLYANFDVTVISGTITGISLAVGAAIVFVSAARDKAHTATKRAELELKEKERADNDANRKAEIAITAAESEARLKMEADTHAARLKMEAAAHTAKLKMQADAERARVALQLELEAKMGPSMTRQIEELKAKLDAAEGRLKEGQSAIEKKLDESTRYRVVIVDDDEPTRTLLCKALSGHGYDCTSVGTLAEARTLLPSRADWFLIDIRLDGENGLDLLREIKDRKYRCWVGVLTGVEPDSLPDADRAYADLALTKPIKPEKLLAAMRSRENMAPRPTLDDVTIAATGSTSGEFPSFPGRP